MPDRTISPRKAEIIKIAGGLFASRGFQGTSIRDIGQAVELLRGSLYSHFSSKEEILMMLLVPAVDELQEVLQVATDSTSICGRERLQLAMSAALDCSRKHRDAILILFQDRELIAESPALHDVSEAAKTIAPIRLSCITAGQGDGSIRAEIAPSTIALDLISLLIGALSDRHLGLYVTTYAAGTDHPAMARTATMLIFYGIVPRKETNRKAGYDGTYFGRTTCLPGSCFTPPGICRSSTRTPSGASTRAISEPHSSL